MLTDPVWGERALAVALRRAQALPAGAGAARGAAAARRGDHLARSLRPPRLPDDPRARAARRAVRHVARRRRAPRGVGRRARAHHRARLVGDARRCPAPSSPSPPRPSQHFSGRGLGDRNATLWSSFAVRGAAPRGLLQRRHRPHPRVRRDPRAPRPVRSRDARGRRVPPGWGDIHLGPENALEALALLGGGALPARALGHLQPGDARLGRARRDARAPRQRARRAARHAAARRRRRAVARRGRRPVVARGRRPAPEPLPSLRKHRRRQRLRRDLRRAGVHRHGVRRRAPARRAARGLGAAAAVPRHQHRQPDRQRRSAPRTKRASCTAISSPRT